MVIISFSFGWEILVKGNERYLPSPFLCVTGKVSGYAWKLKLAEFASYWEMQAGGEHFIQ